MHSTYGRVWGRRRRNRKRRRGQSLTWEEYERDENRVLLTEIGKDEGNNISLL